MPCSFCNRDKTIVARGYCNACYQRWRKTGSVEYQRWGKRQVCHIGGCDREAVSHGHCDTHRKRLERHGHIEETRPDDWGAKNRHPLYNSWAYVRRHRARHPMCASWENDFLQFAMDVGDRPSAKHKLFAADDSKPLGPDNFVWKRAITERAPGEDEKTYMNRAQKVYRAVRREEFSGYELKRHYGLSRAEYQALNDAQNGTCAICKGAEKLTLRGRKAALAVDHCHLSGRVRGLLCADCNRAIGMLNDDPTILRAAIAYLEKHQQ